MGFDNKGYNNKLQILNQNNQKILATFTTKIISTNPEMEKGLMNVKNFPENYCLLFDFQKENIVTMWMKNTLIPLDMIFIDKNNKIVKIVHSATPLSENIISSGVNAVKVLEINGGLAKKFKIKNGDQITITN